MCWNVFVSALNYAINSSDAGKRKVQTVGYSHGFISEMCEITVQQSSVESCFKKNENRVIYIDERLLLLAGFL